METDLTLPNIRKSEDKETFEIDFPEADGWVERIELKTSDSSY
jgi:hypothetical protein